MALTHGARLEMRLLTTSDRVHVTITGPHTVRAVAENGEKCRLEFTMSKGKTATIDVHLR